MENTAASNVWIVHDLVGRVCQSIQKQNPGFNHAQIVALAFGSYSVELLDADLIQKMAASLKETGYLLGDLPTIEECKTVATQSGEAYEQMMALFGRG